MTHSVGTQAGRQAHVYVTPGPPRRNDAGATTAHPGRPCARTKAYDELMRRVREESLLTTVEALLEWDEETYMPPGGVENRSEQMALVAGLLHDRGTDPRLGELLAARRGLRRCWPIPTPRPRSTSGRYAANTTDSCGCRGSWSRRSPGPRRWRRRRGRRARGAGGLRAVPPLARADRRAQARRGRVRGLRRRAVRRTAGGL